MAARDVVIGYQYAALSEIRDIIEKHNPEVGAQLRLLGPADGVVPNSFKLPDETVTFLAQAVAALAKLVDQQAQASAPKRRGRPPKARKRGAS